MLVFLTEDRSLKVQKLPACILLDSDRAPPTAPRPRSWPVNAPCFAVSPFRPHRGPEAVASPDEGEPSCSSAGSPATKSMAHPRVASPPFASPSKNPDARQTSTLSRIPAALLAGFLVCLLALGMFEALSTFIRSAPHVPLERAWSATAAGGDSSPIRREAANAVADDKPHTLVMYVYSNTNPQYPDNLKFFVRHGIPGCSGCRYVIIINEDEQHQVRTAEGSAACFLPRMLGTDAVDVCRQLGHCHADACGRCTYAPSADFGAAVM